MEEKMHVNLWELIVSTAAAGDINSENCQQILAHKGPRFGTELSLTIYGGQWSVRIFDHTDMSERTIELTVWPDGSCSVERVRRREDVLDCRTVSF